MGKYYYQTKKFNKSIEFFDKVDQYDLSDEDQNEFLFKLGYSNFMKNKQIEAKVLFSELLQKQTNYEVPATYYFSHIAYKEGKYQTALEGFKKISENKMFKPIIPYYITQILYQQNKYNELIEYAPSYIDSITDKRKGEFAKLTLLDVHLKWQYNEESNISKSNNSPLFGQLLTGKSVGVINGEKLYFPS